MLVLDRIRCTQRTLLCDPFFRSIGRKLLRQPEAAPANGYGRRLAAAAARRRQSDDEVLQVSQIAVDPVGLHIILLCLGPIPSGDDPDNGLEEGVQVQARDRNDHANTLVQFTRVSRMPRPCGRA